MASSLIPFDPKKLANSLRKVSREAAPMAAFLKMDKTGTWTYGANAVEVAEDQQFIINPQGFQHGYVAWTKGGGDKLGEVMRSVEEDLPETGPVPGGAAGWEQQTGCHLKALDGDMELVYRSSSVGGKRAIADLMEQVGNKLLDGDDKCVPVVTLSSESYKHKSYGKIFNPIITVVKWITVPTEKAPAKAAPKKLANKKR